jgi:hypothetical protein
MLDGTSLSKESEKMIQHYQLLVFTASKLFSIKRKIQGLSKA